MNSEKVKEIKEALEYCSNHSVSDCSNVCPYDKYTRCRTELTKDSLTLINELESENERLNKSDTSKEESSIEYYNLYRDFKRENQQLKDRIAKLKDKIENGTLIEIPCKVGDNAVAIIDTLCYPNAIYNVKLKDLAYIVEDENGDVTFQHITRIFRTEAEAEAKLKELQNETN